MSATLLLLATTSAMAGEWGHFEGQIVLEGDIPKLKNKVDKGDPKKRDCNAYNIPDYTLTVNADNKGIQDIFVFLRTKPEKIHPDGQAIPESFKLDIKVCQYQPYAAIIRTGQSVTVTSSDSFAHNVNVLFKDNDRGLNFAIAPKPNDYKVVNTSLTKAELQPAWVRNQFYPHMVGWWLITDHPYNAITDKDGKFKIEDLPPGDYDYAVWHSRSGWINNPDKNPLKVTITADETTTLDTIKVDVDTLVEPGQVVTE